MAEAESSAEAEESFTCPICAALLVDPVTVACGHTACKRCLAMYFSTAPRPRCPAGCQTPLTRSMPGVNVLVKNRINALFPTQAAERRSEVAQMETDSPTPVLPDTPTPLAAFGALGAPNLRQLAQDGSLRRVTLIVVASVCATLIGTMLYPDGLQTHMVGETGLMPSSWSTDTVVDWLDRHNLHAVTQVAKELRITGKELMLLTKQEALTTLDLPLPVATQLVYAVRQLKIDTALEKAPTDLWELRSEYAEQVDVTTILFRVAPRFVLLLSATETHTPVGRALAICGLSPGLLFYVTSLFFPRLVIAFFLLVFANDNPVLTCALVAHMVQLTLSDYGASLKQYRQLKAAGMSTCKAGVVLTSATVRTTGNRIMWMSCLGVVWHFLPALLKDWLISTFFVGTVLVFILAFTSSVIFFMFKLLARRLPGQQDEGPGAAAPGLPAPGAEIVAV